MPTYQYTCTECSTPLEAVQSFSDAALTTCPTCGGRLRKVFSAVGVVFKGSGFYRNDSRDSGKQKVAAGASESAAGTSTADGSAKGDAATAKTADGASAGKNGASADSAGTSKPAAATAGSATAKKPTSSSGTTAA